MATQSTTGEVRAFPGPPIAAVALFAERLLANHSAHEIAEAIEVLVDVLDMLGGDPDKEDDDPKEDDDSDYCLASEDRGTDRYMPPALFSGYASAAVMNDCDDDERKLQPVTLNPV